MGKYKNEYNLDSALKNFLSSGGDKMHDNIPYDFTLYVESKEQNK